MIGRSYSVTDPTGALTIDFNQSSGGILVPDTEGCYWFIESLEGWDGPDVRQVTLDEYGDDGVAMGVQELQSRLLTLSNGFASCPSEAARWAAELRYAQLLSSTLARGPNKVVVHEDINRTIYGYLASKPEYKEASPGPFASLPPALQFPFQFEASIFCPEPVKTSPNALSPVTLIRNGSKLVTVGGTYPTWPVIEFFFPANNDSITDGVTGRQIVITDENRHAGGMPDFLTIDLGNKTVVDGHGNSGWDCVLIAEFWQMEPGVADPISYHLGSTSVHGTQKAQISWLDSWL